MFQCFSGFLLAVIFTFMLISCAEVEKKPRDYAFALQSATPNGFAAWDISNNLQNSNNAVEDLLRQADVLIKQREMGKASDKLERLLRIEPDYAQAWSRLCWIALQEDKLSRAQQMAQRSNSHATSKQLKILNWSFIRKAASRSGDVATTRKAEQMIDSLSLHGGPL